jgi:tetratricopeptide (TPR) repeat protein
MYKIKIFFLLSVVVLFNACSQKLQIKALKSGQVKNNSIKNIGISPFQNDNISQASQIDSVLSNLKINNKPYFNVIDRNNLSEIMSEQKLNDSGLVNITYKDNSQGLEQMQAILSGVVNVSEISTSRYSKTRTDYSRCLRYYYKKGKKYCATYRRYTIGCRANTYSVKTSIKILNINDASTIFTKTYASSSKRTHCSDDTSVLPSKKEENTRLASNISHQIINDIAPKYIFYSVKLLTSVDIDLSSKQDSSFDVILEMIKLKRIKKAKELLSNLNTQTNNSSYVLLYNLALLYEYNSDYSKAEKLLKRAENIALNTGEVSKEISNALIRIQRNTKEHKNIVF